MKYSTITALLILVSTVSCSYVNKKLGLKDDNIIEESAEALIKSQIGLDIDLTPNSPEE